MEMQGGGVTGTLLSKAMTMPGSDDRGKPKSLAASAFPLGFAYLPFLSGGLFCRVHITFQVFHITCHMRHHANKNCMNSPKTAARSS
jgi:hypothetical protein